MAKVVMKSSAPTRALEWTPRDVPDQTRGNLEAGEHKHIDDSPAFPEYVSEDSPTSRQLVKPARFNQSCGIQMERR